MKNVLRHGREKKETYMFYNYWDDSNEGMQEKYYYSVLLRPKM